MATARRFHDDQHRPGAGCPVTSDSVIPPSTSVAVATVRHDAPTAKTDCHELRAEDPFGASQELVGMTPG
ncbi:hypothetical protein [Nocardia higoensis]|uniref:hypothetical protein n=1 Tax=Nocardia higoensis TaxID=228599 RepID=UPI000593BDC9|nr:hypothetical protein [Nocardia higoensis]